VWRQRLSFSYPKRCKLVYTAIRSASFEHFCRCCCAVAVAVSLFFASMFCSLLEARPAEHEQHHADQESGAPPHDEANACCASFVSLSPESVSQTWCSLIYLQAAHQYLLLEACSSEPCLKPWTHLRFLSNRDPPFCSKTEPALTHLGPRSPPGRLFV